MWYSGTLFFVLCVLVDAVRSVCEPRSNSTCRSLRKRSLLFIEKKACYHDLGCFSSGPPFYHPIYRPFSLPPQSPELIKTMFMLYTRKNRNRPIIILPHRPHAIKKSTFDPNAISRMIIHGLNDNLALTSWCFRMKDALLDRSDENVFIVDWSGSNRIPYTIAVANSRLVGAQIARFIQYLYAKHRRINYVIGLRKGPSPYSRFIKRKPPKTINGYGDKRTLDPQSIQIYLASKTEGADPESFHLIGHSLGAHLAGYAGERFHTSKLGRITGLDPAGPFFRNVPDNVRLDPSDAVFVDVIHTDPGTSILQGYGTPEDGGDLDFYPGGGDPPGCEQTVARSIAEKMPTEVVGNLISCQHFRAYEFFIYSFNQNGCLFVGAECSSWEDFLKGYCNCGSNGQKCALMGIFSPTYTFPNGEHHRDRRLYLKVGPDRPYCVHQYQVVLYLHTLSKYKTYGFESMYIEVTIIGSTEKMKGKLRLDINLAETNQIKKYLLSTDIPVGNVKSAVVTFKQTHHDADDIYHHQGTIARSDVKSDTIVDRMEINYIFPLPKSYTSSLLCRTSEEASFAERKFIFSANVCH